MFEDKLIFTSMEPQKIVINRVYDLLLQYTITFSCEIELAWSESLARFDVPEWPAAKCNQKRG
jgi:hypothetical protein